MQRAVDSGKKHKREGSEALFREKTGCCLATRITTKVRDGGVCYFGMFGSYLEKF